MEFRARELSVFLVVGNKPSFLFANLLGRHIEVLWVDILLEIGVILPYLLTSIH